MDSNWQVKMDHIKKKKKDSDSTASRYQILVISQQSVFWYKYLLKLEIYHILQSSNMNAKRSGSSIYKSETINFYKRAIEYENTDAMVLHADMLYN